MISHSSRGVIVEGKQCQQCRIEILKVLYHVIHQRVLKNSVLIRISFFFIKVTEYN